MLARLSPQTKEEHEAIRAAGMDTTKIYTQDDLVKSDQIRSRCP
ncbi:MAG: fructose-bisphosphatase class II [Chloroflexota bacterium]